MKICFSNYMIRTWQKEDASFIEKYANNRKIWISLRDVFPFPYTLSDAETFLSMARSDDPETLFAIASDNEAIGGIGFSIGKDVHRYTAELGYWLGEPFWNKGIMSQAVDLDYRLCFHKHESDQSLCRAFCNKQSICQSSGESRL